MFLKSESFYYAAKVSVKETKPKYRWMTALQAAVTIIILAVIVKIVDIKAIFTTVVDIGAPTLIIVGILYIGSTVVKAYRLKMCGLQTISLVEMVFIVWIQSSTNNVLPGRIGDAAVFFLTGRKNKVGWAASGVAVLLTLFADISALVIIVAVALPFSGLRIPGQPLLITAALLVVALAWGAAAALAWKSHHSIKPLFKRWLVEGIKNAHTFLKIKNILFLIVLSLLLCVITMVCNYLILCKMDVNLHIWQVIIACSGLPLISLLPIQPVGGWGFFEAALIPGLVLFGISPHDALPISISMHVVNYCYFIPLGIAGYGFFSMKNRIDRKRETGTL